MRRGLRRGGPAAEPGRCAAASSGRAPGVVRGAAEPGPGRLPPDAPDAAAGAAPLRRGPAPALPGPAPLTSLAAGSAHQQAPPLSQPDVLFPLPEWPARPVNHPREGRAARPARSGASAAVGRGGRSRPPLLPLRLGVPPRPAPLRNPAPGAGRVGKQCPEVKGRTPSLCAAPLGCPVGCCPLGAAAVAAPPRAEALGCLRHTFLRSPLRARRPPGPGRESPGVRGRARRCAGPGGAHAARRGRRWRARPVPQPRCRGAQPLR